MTAYKCIRCGKQMDIGMDDKAGECGFCGSVQALPFIRNETMAKSYLTANSYFVENEYIKAEGYYEQLAKENPLDPLPQWMLLLCEYGVQYCRENDSSHWKPTIHRFQERRVVSDASYVATIRLADEGQRALFECEAEELERLRQRIQTVSEKEMPVDVFISYKDKDDGILTNDHTWAETLYHDLKRQGLRVFYAPVSLRGKVGDFYEPYIYAAIHSAKVMIVLGTKREYFNSPWIRNEWDRYLTLKNDEKDARLLMVVYRNMTPDELPEQLLHSLQPIEMKDDWLQTVESRVASVVSATGMELPRILKRGFDFLERGDTERADRQFETMLNTDNQSKTAYAMAYVGKLMLDLNVKTLQELSSMKDTFDTEENYQMAIREDSPSTTGMLEDITRRIIEKKEYKRQLAIYDEAKAMIEGADGEEPYRKAAERLSLIFGFQDASELHTKCLEKAEEHRKDAIYQSAIEWMGKNTVDGYTEAIKKFNSIPEWRDSLSQAEKCRGEIERLRTSAYTQGKGKMMEAASEQDFAMAAACFETAGGYEESVFLAEYSRKAGREAFVNATFVDMIESMYQGNIERFDEASDHLQKLFEL